MNKSTAKINTFTTYPFYLNYKSHFCRFLAFFCLKIAFSRHTPFFCWHICLFLVHYAYEDLSLWGRFHFPANKIAFSSLQYRLSRTPQPRLLGIFYRIVRRVWTLHWREKTTSYRRNGLFGASSRQASFYESFKKL